MIMCLLETRVDDHVRVCYKTWVDHVHGRVSVRHKAGQ